MKPMHASRLFTCLLLTTVYTWVLPVFAESVSLDLETPPEISFDIWDWTAPCKDISLFEEWVKDLKHAGVDRVEISVPWALIEPEPGLITLDWLQQRIEVCQRHEVGMRLRINSFHGGATPSWYDGHTWKTQDGSPAPQSPPSIMDGRFWDHFGPVCTAIAGCCQGKDIYLNAFIGIHAELKWADWWHFDDAAIAEWKTAIAQPRPAWLLDVVAEDAVLPDMPIIPASTHGLPDASPASRAVIAFREWCWREAMRHFRDYVFKGDPNARISVPLGESYRNGSAQMSNCDYWGLSRGARQVVHSYDFFQHVHDGAWEAAASVLAFRGITGLPVAFEYDSEGSTLELGYSVAHLLALGRHASMAGAGLKIANYSYQAAMPSERVLLPPLISLWKSEYHRLAPTPDHQQNRENTVLLFLSKWTQYSYRELVNANGFGWVHDAQFGVIKLLMDMRLPFRVICEENLEEDLTGYKAIILALSPLSLLPTSARNRLAALQLPRITDYPDVPPLKSKKEHGLIISGVASFELADTEAPIGISNLNSNNGFQFGLEAGDIRLAAYRPDEIILGYSLGLEYLHSKQPNEQQGLLLWSLENACRNR